MRARVVSVLLSMLAVGCEARVSVGAPCVSAADCPAGVCAAGRCRDACDELRDCVPPFTCVLDEMGRGACGVAQDEGCTRDEECAEPLVCVDRACVQRCDEPRDCAAGQACVAGNCARPPTTPCDLLSGEGCEPGRRCELLPDDTIGCAAVTARTDEMLALHEPCGPTDTCEPGLACAGGRCARYCLRDDVADEATTSCGRGSACFRYDEVGAPAPTPTIGFCSQPCDPVTQTGCTVPAHRCEIAFAEPLRQTSCRYGDVVCDGPPGAPGCALGTATLGSCAPAHFALHYLRGTGAAGPIEQLCLRSCDDDGDCGSGFRCYRDAAFDVEDLDGRARRIGSCLPACEAGACLAEASALGLACEPSGQYCTAGCRVDGDCYPSFRCSMGRCTLRGA